MSDKEHSSAASQSDITRWLIGADPVKFSAYAIAAAFTTYFCMYAFRKPFAAGAFEGTVDLVILPPLGLKILFVTAQVLGYCTSKFAGIKIISEMNAARRAIALVVCIGVAELALLGFATVPPPYNAICLVFNGLPLGMVWGLVFGFLEGRRVSEGLGAGLSASYIVASGAVKTVGRTVMDFGVSEYWMPFVTGLLFLPLFLVCVYLLAQLPPPSKEDERLRVKREPMDGKARTAFVASYFPGLAMLTFLYIFLTAYRDFRDNFAVQIWAALGYEDTPSIMTTAEIPIAVCVLIVLALLMGIKNNRKALLAVHGIMAAGPILIGLSTVAYQAGILPPAAWMITVGLGLYVAYVPYGCVLFDRMIAALGVVGTAGFLIYVTDAFGYLGSVVLMMYKNFGEPELSWLDFFIGFSYVTAILCTACFVGSTYYFSRRSATEQSTP